MSIPALGHLTSLSIAKEATYATAPASATAKYDIADFSIDQNQSVIEDPNMNSSGASARSIEPGLQFVTFSFRMRWGYAGCEEMMRFLLPTYSQATVDTSARDHTFKEGIALSSYTFEPTLGNIPTGKVTRLVGCYCTGWRFVHENGALVMEITGAAASAAPNTTPMSGAPTVGNRLAIPFHGMLRTAGNLKDGSGIATETNIFIRSVGLTVTYPHDTQRSYLGSVNADSPVRNGPMSARMEFEAQWDLNNYVLMAALQTNVLGAGGLKILFQHGTLIGAVSAKSEFEIIAAAPKPAGYSKAIPGPGVITQRYAYALEFDPSAASCLVVRNRSVTAALA